jgi:uncharacterized membrane protein YkoI
MLKPQRVEGSRPMRSRTLLAMLLAAVPLMAAPAHADDDDDHERVRVARQAGRILPLAELLARVEAEHPGEVLEVELEDEHGRLVYEIKLLRPGGRLAKLYFDAASGAPVTRGRD